MPPRRDYYTNGDIPAVTWQSPRPLTVQRPNYLDNFQNAKPINYYNVLGMVYSDINDPLGYYNVITSRQVKPMS